MTYGTSREAAGDLCFHSQCARSTDPLLPSRQESARPPTLLWFDDGGLPPDENSSLQMKI